MMRYFVAVALVAVLVAPACAIHHKEAPHHPRMHTPIVEKVVPGHHVAIIPDLHIDSDGEPLQDPVWDYDLSENTKTGPAAWGGAAIKFAMCRDGHQQSPIDLVSTEVGLETDAPALEVEYRGVADQPAYKADPNYGKPLNPTIVNNGHSLSVEYPEGSTAKIDGKDYELQGFHFHSPSEHTVDGKHFDLELHAVHKSADGELMVISLLHYLDDSNGDNPFLAKLALDQLPSHVNGVAGIHPVNLAEGLPADKSYYHYKGSLTTPPCTQHVQWYVLETPASLSQSQLEAFQHVLHHNNRPTQPLNGRSVIVTKALFSETKVHTDLEVDGDRTITKTSPDGTVSVTRVDVKGDDEEEMVQHGDNGHKKCIGCTIDHSHVHHTHKSKGKNKNFLQLKKKIQAKKH